MIRQITIRCDWRGCRTMLTYDFHTLRPHAPGWRVENDGLYSLHLYPQHSRKSSYAVREAQSQAGEAPTTR